MSHRVRSVTGVGAAFVLSVLASAALLFPTAPALAASELKLPEGRGWELVSPVDKHGALVVPTAEGGGVIQAAEDGSAVSYIATGPTEGEPAGNRAFNFAQILSKRGPAGWETQDITPPNNEASGVSVGESSEYKLFSSNLSSALLEPDGETPLTPPQIPGEAQEKTIYLRDDLTGSFEPLVTTGNVLKGAKFGEPKAEPEKNVILFAGASPDLTHVVFSSNEALTPGTAKVPKGRDYLPNLYEWSGGALQQVSILPGGTSANTENLHASLGLADLLVRNAVSADGSRVIWEAFGPNPHTAEQERHVYLRDMPRKETLQLSTVTTGTGKGEPIAYFRGASSDGSRVFFTEGEQLTSDSRATGTQRPDLYVFELSPGGGPLSGSLTDLTKDTNVSGGQPESAAVDGDIIGYSTDGSYVYYVASGALAAGATPGAPNVYVDHFNGAGWSTRFVATLSGLDYPDWGHDGSTEERNLLRLTARVSPSGQYLAFMSDLSLTGYDNQDANSGASDEEVYLYNAYTQHTVCASCNPTGAPPDGVFDTGGGHTQKTLLIDETEVWSAGADAWLAGTVPGWSAVDLIHALYQPRYLLDSGQLFFDSPDDLVPDAVNGKEDVYQYRPETSGVCDSTTTGPGEVFKSEAGGSGCVSLLSSGTSPEESAFLDASTTGEDVFFLTSSKLASKDTDTLRDVYDAHVCTAALPCPSEVTVPPACTDTDSCRAAPAVQPEVFGAPSSATFSGNGNAAPAAPAVVKPKAKAKPVKCKRGFVKRRAKCVRVKAKRKGKGK